MKRGVQFLSKVNMCLPCNTAILLLGTYCKEMKIYAHTETRTWIFVAAWFIIDKSWKQSQCHCIGEELNKLWYIVIWNTTQHWKRIDTLNSRQISRKLYWGKKKPIWKDMIHLYNILDVTKWYNGEQISCCQGFGGEWLCLWKGSTEDSYMELFCMSGSHECTHVIKLHRAKYTHTHIHTSMH